jgi:hypothetical protein
MKTDLDALKDHPGVLRLYQARLGKLSRIAGGYQTKCPFHNEQNGEAFTLDNKNNGRWFSNMTAAYLLGESCIDFC